MGDLRSVIIELLSQLGSSREAREYLKRFSSVDSYQFAVVKVGGGILQDSLPELVSALAFLRHVGLLPIVLHGAGPQLNKALAEAGIEPDVVDGMRVTTPEVMEVARPVIYEQNLRLVEALEGEGVRARSLMHGVFESVHLDPDRYGLVGDVVKVRKEALKGAIDAGALPILACLGETRSGQVLNINADVAARSLVLAVEPYKVIFLTPTGGMLDDQKRVISAINLATDYDRLMETDWVHSGMRLKLIQVKYLLDRLPKAASVSITSADHLTRELFTHKGAGTLIRKGERFVEDSRLDGEKQRDLRDLLESCFERTLRQDYFEQLDLKRVIWADSRRAAAVLTPGNCGAVYMDKFAVTPGAQGEGLGAALWQQVRTRHPKIYWRSRLTNPINEWYHRKAQISYRDGGWRVFARGLSLEELHACAEDALDRPESWRAEVAS